MGKEKYKLYDLARWSNRANDRLKNFNVSLISKRHLLGRYSSYCCQVEIQSHEPNEL